MPAVRIFGGGIWGGFFLFGDFWRGKGTKKGGDIQEEDLGYAKSPQFKTIIIYNSSQNKYIEDVLKDSTPGDQVRLKKGVEYFGSSFIEK
jgi:hypothetical protein